MRPERSWIIRPLFNIESPKFIQTSMLLPVGISRSSKRPKMPPSTDLSRISVARRFACSTNWWDSCYWLPRNNTFLVRLSWKFAHAILVMHIKQFQKKLVSGHFETSSQFEKLKCLFNVVSYNICDSFSLNLCTAKPIVQNERRNTGEFPRSPSELSFRMR